MLQHQYMYNITGKPKKGNYFLHHSISKYWSLNNSFNVEGFQIQQFQVAYPLYFVSIAICPHLTKNCRKVQNLHVDSQILVQIQSSCNLIFLEVPMSNTSDGHRYGGQTLQNIRKILEEKVECIHVRHYHHPTLTLNLSNKVDHFNVVPKWNLAPTEIS